MHPSDTATAKRNCAKARERVPGYEHSAGYSFSSSAVRRFMKSVTSSTIFLSARVQAILKRRCQLSGRSMLRRRVRSVTPSFVAIPNPVFVACTISTFVGDPVPTFVFFWSNLTASVASPTFVGSLPSTIGEMRARVSCPAPRRSKADMTSAVSCGGFGAWEKDLLIGFKRIQQFVGQGLNFAYGGIVAAPFKDRLAHRQGLGIGNALLDFSVEDRDAGIGRHSARIAAQDGALDFAGNHKPTFEGWLKCLSFLELSYDQI